MKFWNNKSQSNERPSEQSEKSNEAFEQKLERIQFQARPDFREDLKSRLMQNLAEENLAEVSPGGKVGRKVGFGSRLSVERHLPSPARLLVGGIGFAAALVLLISVLSVGTLTAERTASATAVAGGVPEVQPNPGSTVSSSTQLNNQLKSFFDPAEAARAVGFAVNTPGYLPNGYKLEYATYSKSAVNTVALPAIPPGSSATTATVTLPALSYSGYLLRYTGPATTAAKAPQLEIAQWQVPFKFEVSTAPMLVQSGTEAVPATGTGAGSNPVVVASQTLQAETVSGTPGYIINGNQWTLQLASAEATPITATTIITSVAAPVNPGQAVSGAVAVGGSTGSFSVAAGQGDPSISFSQVGTAGTGGSLTVTASSGVLIQFSTAASVQNVKTLVWQQDSVFTMISSPGNLSDKDLKQIAESLKPAG